jgi:o-succinylbenzoate---CoA ligase
MFPQTALNFKSDVVEKFADEPALISHAGEMTYREYYRKILTTVGRIKIAGFTEGEVAPIFASPSPEYVILLQALWYSRIIALPLNTRWPAALLKKQLQRLGCKKIIVEKELENLPIIEKVEQLKLESLVPLSSTDLSEVVGSKKNYDPQQPATIIFTSGSSGDPKAALHTLGNHFYNALGSNQNIPFGPGDRWLLFLPLYHVGGLAILFRTMLGGGAVVIPDRTSDLENTIRKYKPSHISLVPTQLYRLLQKNEIVEELRKMKAILLGGGAIPDSLIRQAVGNGLSIHSSYGSTEMASQIATTRVGESADKLRTSGKLLPYRELQISTDGEILVKGKTLFYGYRDGERISRATDAEGWFHTGDLGYLDEDGYLTVTGRKDNLFISGGENIQPEEIERTILQIAGVIEAMVVPVKSEEFGERPAAFVKMEQGSTPDFSRIKNHLEKELPRYKIPDYFFPWPEEVAGGEMKLKRKKFAEYVKKILLKDDHTKLEK